MKPLLANIPYRPGKPLHVGVLVSGNGSNLQALIDASQKPGSPFRIVLVIANVPGVFALERARQNKIATTVISHKEFSSREDFEKKIVEQLREYHVELIVLAGFMRVLSGYFLGCFPNRVVNVHPALCPSFPGTHAVRQALQRGVRYTGCTIHLVTEGVDEGPIIAQAVVPVAANDDEDRLQQRIQEQEHRLLPIVIAAIAKGEVLLNDNRIMYKSLPS